MAVTHLLAQVWRTITNRRSQSVGRFLSHRGKIHIPPKVFLPLSELLTPCLNRGTADREDPVATTGAGHNLWSRLASAAGTLGVDVGKAWTTNVAVRSGEGMFTNNFFSSF